MFVFDDRYIEVIFRKQDFAHLTGTDRKLFAQEFYKEAQRGTLRENQIWFSTRYPYDLCKKKTRWLEQLPRMVQEEGFVLEDISTDTAIYKFGFTELNFTLALGEDLNDRGEKRSDYFVPKSFRVEDCFEKSKNVYEISHVFKKNNDEKLYNTVMQGDKNLQELPESVKIKLVEELKR